MLRLLTIFLFTICWAHSAAAQSNSSIYITADVGSITLNESFAEDWEPSTGIRLGAEIPFYVGRILGGLRLARFDSDLQEQGRADFDSYFIHIGYTVPIRIADPLHVLPAIRFGNHYYSFEEPATYVNESGTERFISDPTESEFSYELGLDARLHLTSHWHLQAGIAYNRTLTFYPTDMAVFSVGFSYSFAQPRWLKNLIE